MDYLFMTKRFRILTNSCNTQFTFLIRLVFWDSTLEEANISQKHLQAPKITLVIKKTQESFLFEVKPINFGTQKWQETSTDIQRRDQPGDRRLPGERHKTKFVTGVSLSRSIYSKAVS